MSRGRWNFRPSYVTRAVKAVAKAGYEPRVQIEPGGKVLVVGEKRQEPPAEVELANEWDSI